MTDYEIVKIMMTSAVLCVGIACIVFGFVLHGKAPGPADESKSGGRIKTLVGEFEIRNAAPGTFFLSAGVVLILTCLYDVTTSMPQSIGNQLARTATLTMSANDASQSPAQGQIGRTPPATPSSSPPAAVATPTPGPQPKPAPVESPKPNEAAAPTIYNEPTGARYVKTDSGWAEFAHPGDPAPFARFVESYRNTEYVVLYDQSRDMYVRLPLKGGMANWSHTNPIVWTDMYYVTPASA